MIIVPKKKVWEHKICKKKKRLFQKNIGWMRSQKKNWHVDGLKESYKENK